MSFILTFNGPQYVLYLTASLGLQKIAQNCLTQSLSSARFLSQFLLYFALELFFFFLETDIDFD
jgi:hypothetical protein